MLNPLVALDTVIDSYRDYLQTEFRARDPKLRKALEDALSRAGFLAQEPYFSAHRPFKQEKRWAELPLDSKLAEAIAKRARSEFSFKHQSDAIEYLLGTNAGPLVVTTGTGSGKTESFLAPVLQAAIDDAVAQKKKPGLVAILLYPMNALANDQMERIKQYLEISGWQGVVDVQMYNRTTTEAEREAMRRKPPHLLLTNYQMLEYLLVRPKDREDLFHNHRLRFLVLDEVHTYRGTLGTNVALLIRRLKAHLRRANPDAPHFLCVGTSATIKSDTPDEPRERAVQNFFGKLAAEPADTIRVIGEVTMDLTPPNDAVYSGAPFTAATDIQDPMALRTALAAFTDSAPDTPLLESARRARILWDLNEWLGQGPRSVTDLVNELKRVPQRAAWDQETLTGEIVNTLRVGAALPEGTQGALRLRAHRFVRGGWEFYRCLNPDCGKLFPKGEEKCDACGTRTAPLYLCRACGADFWRLNGAADGLGTLAPFVETNPYVQTEEKSSGSEWLMFQPERWQNEFYEAEDTGVAESEEEYETEDDDSKRMRSPKIQRLDGSFDSTSLSFTADPTALPHRVSLYNSRRVCPGCGTTGGPRPIVTRVSLGTSAAVKVLAEGLTEALPTEAQSDDKKKRLLVFADSRQDAAHQARFVHFAARYDRMRQRVVQILNAHGQPLLLQRVVEELAQLAAQSRDNPHLPRVGRAYGEDLDKVKAWEEAPLLDDLAVNTRYRATLENLGLVAVRYQQMDAFMETHGQDLAERFGMDLGGVRYLVAQTLDTLRRSGVLHRDLLRHHPDGVTLGTITAAAEWERRLRAPSGLLPGADKYPAFIKGDEGKAESISVKSIWSRGGKPTTTQQLFTRLTQRMSAKALDPEHVVYHFRLLAEEGLLKLDSVFGAHGKPLLLYQVNDAVVELTIAAEATRARCDTCTRVVPDGPIGMPCPRCEQGTLRDFPDRFVFRSRYAKRALNPNTEPLIAEEHTAQVTAQHRKEIEDQFKSKTEAVNFLACSPTLELGIDVGQLDAVVMRNIPPRPDNYAQRGGRAGRRSRVGLVLGYTRATPHDQYFFDHPDEMIAGSVPAPTFALGNRDTLLRHVYAIACGMTDPGLAGAMRQYVDFKGEAIQVQLDELLAGVRNALPSALVVARDAFGQDALQEAGLDDTTLQAELEILPDKLSDAIQRTAIQVQKLHAAMDPAYHTGQRRRDFLRTSDLINKLLGIPDDRNPGEPSSEIGSAYPLRRFAEFGILPGYEFPVEPATLRLVSDQDEWAPLSTARPAGIRQYQPDAPVYARGKRWKVFGLDLSSPWNPQGDQAAWQYMRCAQCGLVYDAQSPRCPRCQDASPNHARAAYAYAGFIARPDESAVADEEDRIAAANRVELHPSWDAEQVGGKWSLPDGWRLEWKRSETVRWVNEGKLNADGSRKFYMFCPQCGKLLTPPPPEKPSKRGKTRAPARGNRDDAFGHAANCPSKGQPGELGSLYCEAKVETLRLFFPWAGRPEQSMDLERWAITLGEALLAGAKRHLVLSQEDLDVLWEHTHQVRTGDVITSQGVITFIDPNVGGSGYLAKIANEFHLVAQAALEHLEHEGCDTACYRCLKHYTNQRQHSWLRWPLVTGTLEGLAQEAPIPQTLNAIDINDPTPWREAFAAGCASPLEHRFLKLFEASGLNPVKQYPIGEEGKRAFTLADFAFPEKRIAVYADGAAFHTADRLRRDRAIERRLENMTLPWRVVRLKARDIPSFDKIAQSLSG